MAERDEFIKSTFHPDESVIPEQWSVTVADADKENVMAATRTPEHINTLVEGFLFGIKVFGCSQSGHEKVAWRVCETRPDEGVVDCEMWDRTAAVLAHERINGKPVPLWWALRGARDPKWSHLYGKDA